MMTAVNLQTAVRVEPIQIDCKDLRVERQKGKQQYNVETITKW